MDEAPALQHADGLIEQADALVVAAGAGMGIDSGLPDFRGRDGFWRAYPALRASGLDFHEIASPRAFRDTPGLAWGFYGHRLALYRRTRPHAGFALLRHWGSLMQHGCTVFTSNVDGHFQQAGFDADLVHECHGSIHHLQCLQPCCDDIWEAAGFAPEVDEQRCRLLGEPPHCPRCGGLARPNILMFGDDGWLEQRSAAQWARLQGRLAQASRPVVVELGAGTAIPSVRHFSHAVVQQLGGRLVRINPDEPEVPTTHDIGLAMGAARALADIARILGPRWAAPDGA